MRKTLVVVLFVTVVAATALADRKRGSDDGPLNRTCPVMEGREVDPDLSVEYRGRRVWFCCRGCVETFLANPEAYVAKLPQFGGAVVAAPSESETEHVLGALHPIAVHFPIGLIMAGALASLLPGRRFRSAATFCVLLAAVSSVPAWLLGGEAEEMKGEMSVAAEDRIDVHEEAATAAMVALLVAGALTGLAALRAGSRPLRLLALAGVLAAAGITGYAGYLGGEVARPGHLDALLRLLPL